MPVTNQSSKLLLISSFVVGVILVISAATSPVSATGTSLLVKKDNRVFKVASAYISSYRYGASAAQNNNETNHLNAPSSLPPPPSKPHHPNYEAREFVKAHNRVRRRAGIPPLKWDRSIARYARRFASTLVTTCAMIHSRGPYGENIYWGQDYDRHTATDAVRAWASESQDYDSKNNGCGLLKECGHYTQIIWKGTTRIGCARVKCLTGGVYIICSYNPPGNFGGESPFDDPSKEPTQDETPTPAPVAQTPPSGTTAPSPPPAAPSGDAAQTPPPSDPVAQTPPATPNRSKTA